MSEQNVFLTLTEEAGLRAEVERLLSALRAIRGPTDYGPWMSFYRAAGGGYEGLQAVAEAALSNTPSPVEASTTGKETT